MKQAKLGVDGNGDVLSPADLPMEAMTIMLLKYSGTNGTVLWTQIYNSGNGTDRATAL